MTVIINRRPEYEDNSGETTGDLLGQVLGRIKQKKDERLALQQKTQQQKQLADVFRMAASRGLQPEISTDEKGGISTKWAAPKPTYGADSLMGGQAFTDPQGNEITGEDLYDYLNPEARNIVKGMVDYTLDPTRVASLRRGMREKYISAAKQVDPFFDMSMYPTRAAFRKEMAIGSKGRNVTSFNTAIEHLGELQNAVGKVPTSNFQPWTGAKRWFTETFQADSPTAQAIAKEDTALTAVAGELATIFKNSSGTDQEIAKWFDRYDEKMSRNQKQAFIDEGIRLMEGRLNAIGGEYERIMGRPYEGSLVHPQSQEILNAIRSRTPIGNHYTEAINSQPIFRKKNDPFGVLQ